MRRWYSPRGARRGLWIAGVSAAIWLGWAVGFSQGVSKPPVNAAPHKTNTHPTNTQVQERCCSQQHLT